jgi:hypothetical protein
VRHDEDREVELRADVLEQFRIWAWAETSSDATGSSQKMNRGFRASAVAIPMRWRSPPLNSCGYQLAW